MYLFIHLFFHSGTEKFVLTPSNEGSYRILFAQTTPNDRFTDDIEQPTIINEKKSHNSPIRPKKISRKENVSNEYTEGNFNSTKLLAAESTVSKATEPTTISLEKNETISKITKPIENIMVTEANDHTAANQPTILEQPIDPNDPIFFVLTRDIRNKYKEQYLKTCDISKSQPQSQPDQQLDTNNLLDT